MLKKITFILSLSVLFICCHSNNIDVKKTDYKFYGNDVDILIIDGCQYFQFPGSHITHKGNCNNPIHRCICGDEIIKQDTTSIDHMMEDLRKMKEKINAIK